MALAAAPPIPLNLPLQTNSDETVPVVWVHAHDLTPIAITSAVAWFRFDLPNDDTWARDPETGVPIAPARQHLIISSSTATPGSPPGWFDPARFPQGEALLYLSHELWADLTAPYTGTWDLTAVSTDDVQKVLARGEFHAETGADEL
jgi:hypothetical protein